MASQYYINPYTGKTFFGFFVQLVFRLWAFVRGEVPLENLASDEIQILVLSGVAISSAIVGTFLILRKMTMLANSLSHTLLIGIVIVYLWTHQQFLAEDHNYEEPFDIRIIFIASILMGLITAFLTDLLIKVARLQEDASTGIIFTSLFAVGIVSVTALTRNVHIGTEVVMGNADALQLADCKFVYLIACINVLLTFLFFKEFKATTFDAGLSKALGLFPLFFNYLLMIQVSLTAIGAFRAVGALMVLAFITGPTLTARLLVHSLGKMLLLGCVLGIFASIIGVAISRHVLSVYGTPLSTAGVVVCTISIIFVLALIYAKRSPNFVKQVG